MPSLSARREDEGSLDGEAYRSILRELPIATLVLDEDGYVLEANASLSELSGYSRRDLVGRSLGSLFPGSSVERLCSSGSGSELRLSSRAGLSIPVMLGLGSFDDRGRRIVLACVSDLTELQASRTAKDAIERRLKGLNRDLEAQVEERTMSLSAAHARIMEQLQLQADLEVAGQIQANLLPKTLPLIEGFDLASRALPSRLVSGDFYDYQVSEDGRCSLMIADISGKGLPAAILASAARSLYRRALGDSTDPGGILRELNREMLPDLELAERFITMTSARLDPESGALELANAGGCGVILFDCSERASRELECRGLPIGLFPSLGLQELTIELRPGAGVLICSDGIAEAANPRGELFGSERLLEAAAGLAGASAEDMAAAILSAVGEFAEGRPLDDDATFFVLMAKPRRMRLDLSTSLATLSESPSRIARICSPYGEELARDMELALSEALANIRVHGYDSREGPVSLEIRLETRGVELFLRERGRAFDLAAVPPPALGQAKERGFGLYLIRKVMDGFSYEPGGEDGNLWTFFKSTRPRAPSRPVSDGGDR
jgi:PAS domain S-box-containing protein